MDTAVACRAEHLYTIQSYRLYCPSRSPLSNSLLLSREMQHNIKHIYWARSANFCYGRLEAFAEIFTHLCRKKNTNTIRSVDIIRSNRLARRTLNAIRVGTYYFSIIPRCSYSDIWGSCISALYYYESCITVQLYSSRHLRRIYRRGPSLPPPETSVPTTGYYIIDYEYLK